MADVDKLNIDSIIQRLLEGKEIIIFLLLWLFVLHIWQKKTTSVATPVFFYSLDNT